GTRAGYRDAGRCGGPRRSRSPGRAQRAWRPARALRHNSARRAGVESRETASPRASAPRLRRRRKRCPCRWSRAKIRRISFVQEYRGVPMKPSRIAAIVLVLAAPAPQALAQDTISATHVFPASLIYARSFLEFVKKANAASGGAFTINVRG